MEKYQPQRHERARLPGRVWQGVAVGLLGMAIVTGCAEAEPVVTVAPTVTPSALVVAEPWRDAWGCAGIADVSEVVVGRDREGKPVETGPVGLCWGMNEAGERSLVPTGNDNIVPGTKEAALWVASSVIWDKILGNDWGEMLPALSRTVPDALMGALCGSGEVEFPLGCVTSAEVVLLNREYVHSLESTPDQWGATNVAELTHFLISKSVPETSKTMDVKLVDDTSYCQVVSGDLRMTYVTVPLTSDGRIDPERNVMRTSIPFSQEPLAHAFAWAWRLDQETPPSEAELAHDPYGFLEESDFWALVEVLRNEEYRAGVTGKLAEGNYQELFQDLPGGWSTYLDLVWTAVRTQNAGTEAVVIPKETYLGLWTSIEEMGRFSEQVVVADKARRLEMEK